MVVCKHVGVGWHIRGSDIGFERHINIRSGSRANNIIVKILQNFQD